MLSSIRLTNTGKIPLSLYCIGGLSIVMNFIECPINCSWCPWESNITSKSARLIPLNPQSIIGWANEYRADLIFLHGAEPYTYVDRSIVERIESGTAAAIGVKANPLIAKDSHSFYTIIDYVDVVVFEVVSSREIDAQVSSLLYMLDRLEIRSKHIEILAVAETHRDLSGVIVGLISSVKNHSIPINTVLADGRYGSAHDALMAGLRREYPLIQAPTADVIEIASTLCPVCRSMVVIRRDGVAYKVNIDDRGRCRVCGYKLTDTRTKKFVKLPVDIPLV